LQCGKKYTVCKMKVTLITYHHWKSKRRAGFHWLADAFYKLGYEVVFVTGAISLISKLKNDFRLEVPGKENFNKIIEEKEKFYTYTLYTNWHPVNMRYNFLNKLSYKLFSRYSKYFTDDKLIELVKDSDFYIFESFPGLFLFEPLKKINSKAKFIYRVSDDMRLLNPHPAVLDCESKILKDFDLVSVPSEYIKNIFPDYPNIKLQYHGINKKLFDECGENPYKDKNNAVFVGVSKFDFDFLSKASKLFPEWSFHIIGPIEKTFKSKNIFYYGEMDFVKTIPYIKYADVALQNMLYKKGVESFTDSLKVLQYSYCRLPIVAPDFIKSERKNIFYYKAGDEESIRSAFGEAMKFERQGLDISQISSWEDLAKKITG
jgi:2-beta-glucuronyltransferase